MLTCLTRWHWSCISLCLVVFPVKVGIPVHCMYTSFFHPETNFGLVKGHWPWPKVKETLQYMVSLTWRRLYLLKVLYLLSSLLDNMVLFGAILWPFKFFSCKDLWFSLSNLLYWGYLSIVNHTLKCIQYSITVRVQYEQSCEVAPCARFCKEL